MTKYVFVCLISVVIVVHAFGQNLQTELIGTWVGKVDTRILTVDKRYNHTIEPMKFDKIEFLTNGLLYYGSGFFTSLQILKMMKDILGFIVVHFPNIRF